MAIIESYVAGIHFYPFNLLKTPVLDEPRLGDVRIHPLISQRVHKIA